VSTLHGSWVLLAAAFCSLVSCGEGRTAPPQPFELTQVVAARIAAGEADLAPTPTVPGLEAWQVEEVNGMVTMLANSRGRLREVPLDSIREDFGPAAIPTLALAMTATVRPAAERVAAAELLGTLPHPAAAEVLMRAVEDSLEPWLRRWCAYHLPATGVDRFVPRLIQRLNYEQDQETFVWLATALARYRNYSGIPALLDLRQRGLVGVWLAATGEPKRRWMRGLCAGPFGDSR